MSCSPLTPSSSGPADRPVTLVTGAGARIGRAIALELAAHGHDVAVHARQPSEQAQATVADCQARGARAALVCADLGDPTDCQALVPRAVAALGRLDALVNNASVFQHDSGRQASPALLMAHWQVNTMAPVLLAQALAAHLGERQAQGAVVNLLDQKLDNPNPDHFSYTLCKAALKEATRLLAMALAPQVRVCAVAPGLTLTSERIDATSLQGLQQAASPLQRGVGADDIARAVRFLLEQPALTDTCLVVDAGQHLLRQPRDFGYLDRTPT